MSEIYGIGGLAATFGFAVVVYALLLITTKAEH